MQRTRPVLLSILLFAALQLPVVATAAPIGLIELTQACGNASNACSELIDLDIAPDPTVLFSNSQTYNTTPFDLAFSAKSRAGFGFYGAEVSASYVGRNAPFVTTARAGAGSLERLTISNPLYNGQAGKLGISWSLDGTMNSAGQGATLFSIQDCIAPAGTLSLLSPPNGLAQGCNFATFETPVDFYAEPYLDFVFGTPFDLRSRFNVLSVFQGTGVGTASTDYLHTMTLGGLNVFTADGTSVPDPVFTSESGTQYSTSGVVPEPTSVLLLGTGLAGLIVRLRRRA